MNPEIKVREGGREVTIYQNDRKCTVIHVLLGKRSSYRITVNRETDGKKPTRVMEAK